MHSVSMFSGRHSDELTKKNRVLLHHEANLDVTEHYNIVILVCLEGKVSNRHFAAGNADDYKPLLPWEAKGTRP